MIHSIRAIVILLGVLFMIPESFARGRFGGGGGGGAKRGGGHSVKAHRGGGSRQAKRSPMTHSRVSRPKSRPAPKQTKRVSRPTSRPTSRPASRPASRPTTRPTVKKPTSRPSVSKPTTRPNISKPSTRPGVGGGNRPSIGGDKRPGTGNRPSIGGDKRPGGAVSDRLPNRGDKRPSMDLGDRKRPSTLPGMVSYPKKSKIGNNNRLGNNNRIGNNRGNNYIGNVNVGRRNKGLNRPGTLPANKRNWDNNKWGGKNSVWGNRNNIGNNVNINVNNRFYNNNNFAYRPNYWGGRPWWGAGGCHGWHHGHWGYGWNSSYYRRHWYYDDNDFAKGFMWGIGVWSMGNMIYNMGYKTYSNPYPAPPVQNTYINYSEPVSVAAAANPPGDDQAVDIAESKSEEALEKARVAFRKQDYLGASKAVDESLGYMPDDITLHEFRALIFFALGKYAEATGVLNAVLASGPGWSWDTMIGFYESSSTYSAQLKKLESYVEGSPDKADARFLLGYHYMVCGEMEAANEQFKVTSELQPADTIAPQLRDLTGASVPDNGEAIESTPAPEAPEPVPVDKLVGTWTSESTNGGTITFTMKESGDYVWGYKDKENESTLEGTYGLNEKGLLVLTADDSQMVSEIVMKDDSAMHFSIIGSPDGDPGLDFKKG